MSKVIDDDCLNIVSSLNFDFLKNKRILITGASGLIGVYITNCLKILNKNYNFNIDINCWINSDIDINFLSIFENCNIIKGDITEQNIIDNFINNNKNNKFDLIIHSAGYGQPNKFLLDKIKTITLNTHTITMLFQCLKENGKFGFFSTSELYSMNNKSNIKETDYGFTMPDHPRSAYIEGKRCGEAICNSFSQIHKDIDIKILRLSLAYGPGTKPGDHRVLNSLIQKGLFQEKINLLDDGSALRTYGYISDIIEMFWNILLFGKEKVYNLCGKSKTSILELAQLIAKNLNKEVTIGEKNSLNGSPKNVNLSLQKYNKEFGKKQFTNLEDGIKKTILWQKEIYGK